MERRSKILDYAFLTVGLIIQVITYCLMPATGWLSLVSGLMGICSVCLCAQGNIWYFLFGFGQVLTYTYLSWQQHFYAEVAMNGYYLVTMVYGVWVWLRRLKADDTQTITPRSMAPRVFALMVGAVLILSAATGYLLAHYTDDTQPYLDALTTVPALVAQVLMVTAYREQWYLWLAIDMVSVVLWINAGDGCMVAQYAFWCINCLYGYLRWKHLAEK